MAHIKHDFCPEMQRRCLKSEYDKPNHLTICHRFEQGVQQCLAPRIPLDFCIDRYEFPNQKGAHPPWMVDWYDAMGHCAALEKRLCYESEWVAACEGPDETPFPSGWERSKERCNIDNPWVEPSLQKIYSSNPSIADPELRRLDRSVPSGSMGGCVSGYGVYDLTGNLDEWALADRDRPEERAVFTALKGGAWGHVRNACRPVTTSHDATFSYYFVSFRCCKDPASMPRFGEPQSGAAGE
jgi:sulfatase modifying factor 1